MSQLIANLFSQAANMSAPGTPVYVDWHGTAALVTSLGQTSAAGPWIFTQNTLVYAPGSPSTFSTYPGGASNALTINDLASPTIQFQGAPLVPTSPPLAHPSSVNVDGKTSVIYGIVNGVVIDPLANPVAGTYFLTITLVNLRTQQ